MGYLNFAWYWAVLALVLGSATPGAMAVAATKDMTLAAAVGGANRTPAFVARDTARHPLEELTFFGVKPGQTVVEIWPEPGYWTEILAPYLHAKGEYYVALQPPGPSGSGDKFKAKLAADPADYDGIKTTVFGKDQYDIAPAGTVDMVLTFRNLHNWMSGGYADAALAAFFQVLKPGGILGIEEHRARPTTPQDPKAASGYVRQDYAIMLAKQAGFQFVGSSEIDANPKDTTDWPKGVWTLPPTLVLGDVDRAKYEAIGEADNFVLKFRKPTH